MGIFDKKRIEFKKPFMEKYRLTVTSDIQTGNMSIKSKAVIRWEVKVKSINEKYINLEIITLDNELIEYNNPLIKSMADMNKVLSGMWSELDLILDRDYELVKINNLELLKEKWERIKSEMKNMLSEEPELISNVINLNDKNFENPDVVVSLIQKSEFFLIYFHHVFGKTDHSISGKVKNKNIFNTALMDWSYKVDRINMDDGDTCLFDVEGYVETSLNRSWIKEFYKAFTHLDLDKTQPVMTEKGKYLIDAETGKIIKAYLEKKEIAHPRILHGTTRYELQLDGTAKKEQVFSPVQIRQETAFEASKGYDPPRSLIIDD
ncbi:MAG: hypothetical protein LBJ72_07225 [Dysgonamonadaceae bacterium]|jgi:hypothetical protein|nr:hypothetical protein [Dysgonamonadaceae bacterium]